MYLYKVDGFAAGYLLCIRYNKYVNNNGNNNMLYYKLTVI